MLWPLVTRPRPPARPPGLRHSCAWPPEQRGCHSRAQFLQRHTLRSAGAHHFLGTVSLTLFLLNFTFCKPLFLVTRRRKIHLEVKTSAPAENRSERPQPKTESAAHGRDRTVTMLQQRLTVGLGQFSRTLWGRLKLRTSLRNAGN